MERKKEEADSCRYFGRMPLFRLQFPGFKSAEIVPLSALLQNSRNEKYIQTSGHRLWLDAAHDDRIIGLFPGAKPAYHYHKNRESVIMVVSGEATEMLEGQEIPLKAGDVIFIPPMVKHTIMNNSGKDFRYIEFFTHPPVMADFIPVK